MGGGFGKTGTVTDLGSTGGPDAPVPQPALRVAFHAFWPDEDGPLGLLMVDHPRRGHVTAFVPADALRAALADDRTAELLVRAGGREPFWLAKWPWEWSERMRESMKALTGVNILWGMPD